MGWTVRARLAGALVVAIVVGGCSTGPTSAEGHTFSELMDGVLADPSHYTIESECFSTDETSVSGRVTHRVRYRLTNTDDRRRAYSVWIFREGEERRRAPQPWLEPGETRETDTFLGWEDDYPAGCPDYRLDVYQAAAEALVEDQ